MLSHFSRRQFATIAIINIIGLIAIYHGPRANSLETVRINTARAMPDAAHADRITMLFNSQVVAERRVGGVEQAQLFQISPPWPGKWIWSAVDTLEFNLEKPLPPGRVFVVKATDELTKQSGKTLQGQDSFRVETVPLKFTDCEVMAADQRKLTLSVAFNQPVDPETFLSHVKFYDKQRDSLLDDPVLLTKTAHSKMTLRISYPSSNAFRMVIDKELLGHEAEIGLEDTVVYEQEVRLDFSLYRAYIETHDPGTPTQIDLRFSDALDKTQEITGITLEPPLADLRVSVNGRYLSLTGDFQPGRQYRITVPETVLAQDGRTLGEAMSARVDVPDCDTELDFKHSRGFLTPHGQLALDMKAVNVEAVEIGIWQVHANNLVHHLHGANMSTISRRSLDKTISLDSAHNELQDLSLDLKSLIKRQAGIYRVEAHATNTWWAYDRALVAVTDLAITAKTARNGSLVWVTSLQSGRPVPDVSIKALTYNNQLLAETRTDEQGIARLGYASDNPDGDLWVITAQKDQDLAYLLPEDNQWVIDNTLPACRAHPQGYDVMLYTDRGIYRPGDTVRLTGIIRAEDGAVPPAFPLLVKVFRPDGLKAKEINVARQDGDQGVFHAEFASRSDGYTGCYTFKVSLPGASKSLGETEAFVEAFVPVRMEVRAEPVLADANGLPEVQVTARYLWDQPGAKLPVKVNGHIKEIRFKSQAYADFSFGPNSEEAARALAPIKGRLSEAGQARLPIQLPKSLAPGLYQLKLSATVTEPGGRSVSDNATTLLNRTPLHIGLALRAGKLVQSGQPTRVDWVRLTKQGELAPPGDMQVRLAHVEYETVVSMIDERPVWKSVVKAVVDVISFEIPAQLGSADHFNVCCPRPGAYRLGVTDQTNGLETVLEFDAHDPVQNAWNTPTNLAEKLKISTDRQQYRPGDTAQVRIQSPITGTLLLTLETDRVVHHQVRPMTGNTMELELPLAPDLRGSFFLCASVVRRVDSALKEWNPHRALGTLQLAVNRDRHELPVEIMAPETVRPGESVLCTVKTRKPIDPNHPGLVHLWAVDEGILLAVGYGVPDPLGFFLGPRRSAVSSADTFFRLLPDYQRPQGMASIGADEFEQRRRRRGPLALRHYEPAIIWQTVLPVSPEGQVSCQLKLPELIGEMKIMAVIVDHDKYAHTEHDLTVTQELIVEAHWPRFAAPGDRLMIPVKLFNSSGADLNIPVRHTVSGPLQLFNTEELDRVHIAHEQPTTIWLAAEASAAGTAHVQFRADTVGADQEKIVAQSSSHLLIRPGTPLHSEHTLLALQAGDKPLTHTVPKVFLPDSMHTTVTLSARPSVHLEATVQSLIEYPYGCVEQTSSQMLSLLYGSQILDKGQATLVQSMTRAGIARLWSMQTRSGGLSYWPGQTSSYLWGTAYASLCLAAAADAGYELDGNFSKRLSAYLGKQLQTRDDEDMDINTKAMVCRVLASLDQPAQGWMARLVEQVDLLDVEGRSHLAVAFLVSGRLDKAKSLLPQKLPEISIPSRTAGRLTSQIRQYAVLLSALLKIEPEHPLIPILVSRLNESRTRHHWGSTLNNSAVVAALADYQIMNTEQAQNYQGTVQIEGHDPIPFDHTQAIHQAFEGAVGPVTVSAQGTGTFYLSVTTQGQLAQGHEVAPYNQGIEVTRRWSDVDGNDIDLSQLVVGDLVQVEISIRSLTQPVHNIAIVNALPAGLEVENPRLATSAVNGLEGEAAPDHIEFLDDRVLLFCSAKAKTGVFRYALRATTAGEFIVPPIQASCMYDATCASLGAAERVTVKEPLSKP